MTQTRILARFSVALSAVLLAYAPASPVLAKPDGPGGGKGGKGGTSNPSTFVPMNLELERYYFRVAGEDSCLGEDDALEWEAMGSLAPGESFSFTPAVPGCDGHPAAITVMAKWPEGTLELTSTVPDADFTSWDPDQAGRMIQAPDVGVRAQLCMFPAWTGAGRTYTVTVTNAGNEAVHDISLHGRHENDWSLYYYPRCLNADADGDGWNDSLEHSMALLLYPIGYIDGVFQPDVLWGSNYLRSSPRSPESQDEIDSYPPDFNDDGRVDAVDLARLDAHRGRGNGVPLSDISPDPGENGFYNNSLAWRRFDLDGDGYVDEADRHIVEGLAGQSLPPAVDSIAPTSRLTSHSNGDLVGRGEYVLLTSHVWDNAAILRVDYLVNGKAVCSVDEPAPDFGFTSPMKMCWWSVPRKPGSYEIEVRVYDAAGNVGSSPQIRVDSV